MNENEARATEESEEAKRWVESIAVADGQILHLQSKDSDSNDPVWWNNSFPNEIQLNGYFSKARLEALLAHMEQHSKEGR